MFENLTDIETLEKLGFERVAQSGSIEDSISTNGGLIYQKVGGDYYYLNERGDHKLDLPYDSEEVSFIDAMSVRDSRFEIVSAAPERNELNAIFDDGGPSWSKQISGLDRMTAADDETIVLSTQSGTIIILDQEYDGMEDFRLESVFNSQLSDLQASSSLILASNDDRIISISIDEQQKIYEKEINGEIMQTAVVGDFCVVETADSLIGIDRSGDVNFKQEINVEYIESNDDYLHISTDKELKILDSEGNVELIIDSFSKSVRQLSPSSLIGVIDSTIINIFRRKGEHLELSSEVNRNEDPPKFQIYNATNETYDHLNLKLDDLSIEGLPDADKFDIYDLLPGSSESIPISVEGTDPHIEIEHKGSVIEEASIGQTSSSEPETDVQQNNSNANRMQNKSDSTISFKDRIKNIGSELREMQQSDGEMIPVKDSISKRYVEDIELLINQDENEYTIRLRDDEQDIIKVPIEIELSPNVIKIYAGDELLDAFDISAIINEKEDDTVDREKKTREDQSQDEQKKSMSGDVEEVRKETSSDIVSGGRPPNKNRPEQKSSDNISSNSDDSDQGSSRSNRKRISSDPDVEEEEDSKQNKSENLSTEKSDQAEKTNQGGDSTQGDSDLSSSQKRSGPQTESSINNTNTSENADSNRNKQNKNDSPNNIDDNTEFRSDLYENDSDSYGDSENSSSRNVSDQGSSDTYIRVPDEEIWSPETAPDKSNIKLAANCSKFDANRKFLKLTWQWKKSKQRNIFECQDNTIEIETGEVLLDILYIKKDKKLDTIQVPGGWDNESPTAVLEDDKFWTGKGTTKLVSAITFPESGKFDIPGRVIREKGGSNYYVDDPGCRKVHVKSRDHDKLSPLHCIKKPSTEIENNIAIKFSSDIPKGKLKSLTKSPLAKNEYADFSDNISKVDQQELSGDTVFIDRNLNFPDNNWRDNGIFFEYRLTCHHIPYSFPRKVFTVVPFTNALPTGGNILPDIVVDGINRIDQVNISQEKDIIDTVM